ncbi:MAG TPA: HAMP domain-containing sensor histidine kinase [Saliniramus sp.]|nr:HAMP domain-containing sensor histidine kinase [Saliniramus sp.]
MSDGAKRAATEERGQGKPRRVVFGLSARLLWLTIAFVMLAEVLIYVPSVANFQRGWLNDRLTAAQIAALVLDAAPEGLPRDLEDGLLAGVGAMTVAVRGGGTRRLLAVSDMPQEVGRVIDLRETAGLKAISDAFTTLLSPSELPILVVGDGMRHGIRQGMQDVDFVEIVIDEEPLRRALLTFSRNILFLSLLISGITAGLIYLSLQWAIVRPVRRLSDNLAGFSQDPEDTARIIVPSGRGDEIGVAEQSLERMERKLADELRQKRRLAELGLGVSKINHELRNMLTTAQLLSDRMAKASDPMVQRFAPRLVATLQRAIDFSEATLAYGRAVEPDPNRRRFPLLPLAQELYDLPGICGSAQECREEGGEGDHAVCLEIDIAPDLVVDADREQLLRVLVNLVRNAVQALRGLERERRRVDLRAVREGGRVTINIRDHGPGLPPRARERLFEPFQSAARPGGSGLGLAICAEIVRLHGGEIALVDTQEGACFEIAIPDRA